MNMKRDKALFRLCILLLLLVKVAMTDSVVLLKQVGLIGAQQNCAYHRQSLFTYLCRTFPILKVH